MKRRLNRNIIAGCIAAGMIFFSGAAYAAGTWQGVESGIDREAARAANDAALTEKMLGKDQKALTNELARIKGEIKAEQQALDRLKAEFKQLSLKEVEMERALNEEHQEVADVEGSVRGALKDAVSMVRDNPITAQHPGRGKMVDAMMDSKKFPGMAGIASLVKLYFDEIALGGKVVRYGGEFIGTDGKKAAGDILRTGRFTAYYRKADGAVGFLKPDTDGRRLIAVAGEVPSDAEAAIVACFDGQGTVLPVDPSGGAVFAQLTEKTDWRETLEQGGLLMYPILAVAAVALLLMIERLVVLGTTRVNTDKITKKVNEAARQSDWDQCRVLCEKNNRVPTCNMLAGAVNHIGATQEVLENALQEAILRQMPRLERFLPTMGVLAAIAPLLGLLGTVTGMINIFRVITVVGTGDPRVMSGGISEALLTTQFGLAVAIPIMIVHHFFERRVDRIVGDMEEKGTAFAVTLIQAGAVTESEASRG